MVTVEYAPGASSAEHRHNAHTFVYVLEGSVVMQVKGGKEVTLGPGQTFYESPDDIHSVSKNASATKPAKFLVFMVKDKGAPADRTGEVPLSSTRNRFRSKTFPGCGDDIPQSCVSRFPAKRALQLIGIGHQCGWIAVAARIPDTLAGPLNR